jgi:lipoyl(octanoyl) transferase
MKAPNTVRATTGPEPGCEARWLGTVPYAEALALQETLVRQRAAGEIPDQLLLLEHPHVLTLGRAGKSTHVLADAARLAQLGVELFETGRGGDVTYHGPGQLVAYPILDLAPDRCDLHRYVRDLERVLVAVLSDYGIHGHVVAGRTGVWVERASRPEAKVAAIGVRVARWITSHGIALNVRTDLRYFDLIVPCGIAGSAVTSVAALYETHDARPPGAAAAPDVPAVAQRFAAQFGIVFGRCMQPVADFTGTVTR